MPTQIPTRTKQLGVRKLAASGEIDYTQYSVKSTFKRNPEASIVLVPWRVFSADPESVCDSFRELEADDCIAYADDINVMMNVEGMNTPAFGILDDFSQTWVISTDEINLDKVIDHIKSYSIVLGLTLTNRKLLGDHEEIPIVAFLDPKTPQVREAVMKLETYRDMLNSKPASKFCVEVDIGDSVSRWAKEVLGQSMTCVGGRFCVTNGEIPNHVFEWSNICAFLPIIICCMFAIPIYKMKRKANYEESKFQVAGDSCMLGAATIKIPDQRVSLLTLMRRARTDPKFERESPDSGVHLPTNTLPPPAKAKPIPVPVAPAAESFTKKNDKTAVLKTGAKSGLKNKAGVIAVDYKKREPIAEQEEITMEREDSYLQADDLDTIARAFKMSKSNAEPRPSVVSPVTLSNFRADLLFCDVDDDDSDEEEKRKRRMSEDNFLDPNYDAETSQYFKKNPNPLTNIELMHFLTTKSKPAPATREDEDKARLEMARKKRAKVGKNWATVQKNFDKGKLTEDNDV